MTDEQFKAIMDGAEEAGKAELYRLAGFLRSAAAVGNDPNQNNIANLIEYAVKVGYDMTRNVKKK